MLWACNGIYKTRDANAFWGLELRREPLIRPLGILAPLVGQCKHVQAYWRVDTTTVAGYKARRPDPTSKGLPLNDLIQRCRPLSVWRAGRDNCQERPLVFQRRIEHLDGGDDSNFGERTDF